MRKTMADAKKLADKGTKLLERYKKSKDGDKTSTIRKKKATSKS